MTAVSQAVSQIAQIIAGDARRNAAVTATTPYGSQTQAVRLSLGQLIIFAVIIFLVIIFLARAGGSGLLGFLLGMFLGGGGRGGWGGGGGGGGDGGGDGGFGGFGGGGTGGRWCRRRLVSPVLVLVISFQLLVKIVESRTGKLFTDNP